MSLLQGRFDRVLGGNTYTCQLVCDTQIYYHFPHFSDNGSTREDGNLGTPFQKYHEDSLLPGDVNIFLWFDRRSFYLLSSIPPPWWGLEWSSQLALGLVLTQIVPEYE